MYFTKNSVIPFFLKKTFKANRLLKNENKNLECIYIRNNICIGKTKIMNRYKNTGTKKFHNKPIYHSENETVENKLKDSYYRNIGTNIRNSNNNRKDVKGVKGVILNKNISSCVNSFKVNEDITTMDHLPGNFEDINLITAETKFKNENPEYISNNYNDIITKGKANNSELIKYIRKKRKKKYIFKEFSVFSFNILANSLVDYKYESNCSNVMKWINRKELIYQCIMNKLSDIICLQEIEESYFMELENKLKLLHYKGLFLKKKKETCKDGICIFYNTRVFELLFFDEIIYDKSLLLKKWHVGLITALRNLHSKKIEYYDEDMNCNNSMEDNKERINASDFLFHVNDIVIVSNTHLIFDSCKGDVKLYQLCYMSYRLIVMINKCINYLKSNVKGGKYGSEEKGRQNEEEKQVEEKEYEDEEKAEKEEKKKNESNTFLKPGVIFCGDLNITPNSLLYYYIINRYINLKNINLKNISGQYLMFKKQYYFYNYLNGNEIKKMFDESILNDLKNEQCSKSLIENIKKESLFSFFKNEDILDEEHLINIFSDMKGASLKNYNSYEYNFYRLKNEDKNEQLSNNDVQKKKRKCSFIEQVEEDYKFSEQFAEINEEKESGNNNCKLCEITVRKEKEKEEMEIVENEEQEDFILYYPLYFESIYNSCVDNRIEKSCYKYDTIDELNNKENNLVLSDIPFTVFHGKQKGCVDYIFYSYKNLKKISCTSFPAFGKLAKYGCLPNEKYSSSDHLYLHATLVRWTDE
ncbi:DNase I-like protein, putative [Plasmodium malariae]|uniref:DNase I-like protein, putative n=1 Tax=Plasmodium malariae TaxID=5858 RepID=A0A1D3SMK8_PLAMA|nr:DNase I-like protein, putative [Plasmodium malariae]SCO92975.1 DNase I-like protein, putative [Plasmodium malariae]